MKDRTPRYKSQSVNYLGFLAKQLGDLRGPSSLAYELIQNADDAKDDSLKLSATRIVFDIRDDALVVSNDAVFREIDFERISDLASGSKRNEEGDRTTGAFGVGFISVYQVTDRPEILSAGEHWILRPEKQEDKRIKIIPISDDTGTKFYLPWAYRESELREKLQTPPVTQEYIETFAEELKISLPKAILFLKKLELIELIDKGKAIKIRRGKENDGFVIYRDDERQEYWRILGDRISPTEGTLKDSRSTLVRVAVPDKFVSDGILFATLPTKGSTGLPFHINADFFPDSSRKSIMFEDKHDPRSEWNRDVLRKAASIVKDNLIVIRDMFIDNPIDFWAMLESLYNINGKIKQIKKDRKIKPDDPIPLELFWDLFWEELKPILETYPIVYTESNQWLKPVEVRILVSNKEWNAIEAFESLGIEIVHQGLKKFRDVLRGVGIKQLDIKDIYEAFAVKGLIGNPQSISLFYQNYERLELMRQGIFTVYDRIKSKNQREKAEYLLSTCVLAPGIDGRIWPSDSVYLGEDDFTYELFSHLLPEDRSFLDRNISYQIVNGSKEGEEEPASSLLRHLCPPFSADEAIGSLEALNPEELASRIESGEFRSEDIIRWFSQRQSEMDDLDDLLFLHERLATLPIFPTSEGSLTVLEDLWMPGDFSDPIGIAKILDMERLKGLSDFLHNLGVEELTFSDYARQYITAAFGSESSVSYETKLQLLKMLEEYIDQIKEDEQLQYELAETSIVECEDGSFRTPKEVYFRNTEVVEVLGDFVSYCTLPKSAKGRRVLYRRRNLYRWLGVASRPRTKDIIRVVDELTDESPDQGNRKSIISCLKSVAKYWKSFSDNEKWILKTKDWLPAIASFDRWYSPVELFTYENKRLFESQASFLDAPDIIQEELGSVLEDLGIESVPQPSQVVKHLLKCSQENIEPAPNVYDWLTEWLEDIPDRDLRLLQDSACLYMGSQYLRPDQIFWRHDFGGYRFQLDQGMISHSELLQAVGVKEEPDHDDALKLLKEISHEMGNNRLEHKDKVAILQCWVILSRALDQDEIDGATIREELHNIKCVPNNQEVLNSPPYLYYEDRPRLKDKFKLLTNSCIQRTEGIYRGMEAAGVRLLSSVIFARVYKEEGTLFSEEQSMRDKILERRRLIITILEGLSNYNSHMTTDNGSVSIDDIRFFSTNELRVNWELEAFNRIESSESAESAHFDREEKAIYFQDGAKDLPWSAIARELAHALALGGSVTSISPGLKVVLEAHDYEDACRQLEDLGIALTEELARPLQPSESVAFDDTPDEAPTDYSPTEAEVTDDDKNDHISVEPDKPNQDQDVPYGQRLYEYRKASPRKAPEHSVQFPYAGSKTRRSAREHTKISAQRGRSGMHITRSNTIWEPTEAFDELAREFRDMVHGDYGKRCQMCGTTFSTSAGDLQVYVVHVLPPCEDDLTNHYGNLLGLCGWHYSLIRYNQDREFFDSSTEQPFKGWEHMVKYVIDANDPDIDEEGNSYFGLGIRFYNIYRQWSSEPTTESVVIRYCEPHWTYLQELLPQARRR